LKVSGMNCQHCVRAVAEALAGVEGVARVALVELQTGRVLVEGGADVAALVAAVAAAGYPAEPVVT
jgi:copper chaperone